MNKEHFNKLVTDYTKLDGQFIELEKLVHQYPYSQPLRVLNAKSSSKQSKAEYHKRLTTAAFYATDRNVLRALIETGIVPSDSSATTAKRQPETNRSNTPRVKQTTKPKGTKVSNKSAMRGDLLREDVIHNLDELLIAKANFFKIMGMDYAPHKTKELQHSAQKKAVKPIKKQDKPTVKVVKPKPTKSKAPVKSTPKTKKKELIDKFIATEPSITPNKVSNDNQSDLTRASSELKEDLVSENLALIFANQGKKAKAIEIYKKLIWKFPQKKASFAARIEELKKK